MLLSNRYKMILIFLCCAAFSLPMTAASISPEEKDADQTIERLYHSQQHKPTKDLSSNTVFMSQQFLQKPYLLTALGEGLESRYDQFPRYRTDGFDCETYVDTVIALALSNDLKQFKRCINRVRYYKGAVSYINRNHFTCLDWNKNNQKQGITKDITLSFHDSQEKSVAMLASAYIDKPSWYQHKTIDTIRLEKGDINLREKRLIALKKEARHLPKTMSTIPYIPLSVLFDKNGNANQALFQQIPNAAIIEIIRPNWDLVKAIGTHLNVSHLGFAIWKNNDLYFRNASSIHQQVIDVPLIDYLRDAQKSPTIKGINVQVLMDDAHCK